MEILKSKIRAQSTEMILSCILTIGGGDYTTVSQMSITVEQLRSLLFNIDDQKMTVRELRQRLFNVTEQDQQVKDEFNFFKTIGVEK